MKKVFITLSIIIVLSIACYYFYTREQIISYYPASSPIPTESQIPQSVQVKYDSVTNNIPSGLTVGVSINFCRKGDTSVYSVSESGGFSGSQTYFDIDGKELMKVNWDDTPPNPKNPFQKYTCSNLKEYEPEPVSNREYRTYNN